MGENVRRVKIVFMQDTADDYYSQRIIRDGTAWEEVTELELAFLQKHIHLLAARAFAPAGLTASLMIEDDTPIRSRLIQLRELLQEEQKAQQKREAEAKKAKLDKELKRKAKTEAQERELLKELQQKYRK